MVFKKILLIFIALALQLSLIAQNNTLTSQMGSKIITGSFTISSLSGQRYTGSSDDKSITVIGSTFDYLTFFANKFAAGPKATFSYRKDDEFKQTAWTFGPKAAYYFDNGSNNIPYLTTSLSYLSQKYKFSNDSSKIEGLQGDLSGGLAIKKGHLLVLLEAGYTYQKAKNNSTKTKESNSAFYLSIGFGVSIY